MVFPAALKAYRKARRRLSWQPFAYCTVCMLVAASGYMVNASQTTGQTSGAPSGLEEQVNSRYHLLSFFQGETADFPHAIERVVKVSSGDTLGTLLQGEDIPAEDVRQITQALSEVYNVRNLKVGQEITLTFSSRPGLETVDRFNGLSINTALDRDVVVARQDDDSFAAQEIVQELQKDVRYALAKVDSSLYVAGRAAGVPKTTLSNMINAYSFNVDFQRDVRKGDEFELAYEVFTNAAGQVVKTGDILYANMVLAGKANKLYYYESKNVTDFFDEKGRSVRKTLIRTPIDGVRISSRFGPRRHPILGYTKMHKGTDFAAGRGTPIKAAGDGVVEMAGRNGGYGNYVRVRHNGTYKTAYAHMKGFAKGVKKGVRVKQGQVIGYVGTTGRSTGPHLHYEVLRNGKQVDPMKITLPSGKQLAGKDLEQFKVAIAKVNTLVAQLRGVDPIEVAGLNLEEQKPQKAGKRKSEI